MPTADGPQLARYPDARRGRLPLASPALLGYTAFMLGPGIAGLLAMWNAALLRRPLLLLASAALGVLGWFGFGALAAAAMANGVGNVQLILLGGRLLGIATGVALAGLAWRHVRGHEFLRGATIPLLQAVLVGFAAQFVLPMRLLLVVQGFWPLLFAQ